MAGEEEEGGMGSSACGDARTTCRRCALNSYVYCLTSMATVKAAAGVVCFPMTPLYVE